MTVVAVSIISIAAYRKYQHRKRIARMDEIHRTITIESERWIKSWMSRTADEAMLRDMAKTRVPYDLAMELKELKDREPDYVPK
jgi:hypothetical protein